MCRSPDELRRQADWDGANGQSRQQLLSALSGKICASFIVPIIANCHRIHFSRRHGSRTSTSQPLRPV
jgi:hypothetical protein